jgi:uncharacterized repeat protein (TIGR01451 family)
VFTNTGNLTLTNVTLGDDKIGVISSCSPNTLPTTLAPGASGTCAATGVATAGQYRNDAVITGTATLPVPEVPALSGFPTPPSGSLIVTDTNPSHYFGGNPGLTLRKYVNGYDADLPTGPYLSPGSAVTWTYVIRNVGNVTMTNVTLNDDKIGAVNSCVPANLPGDMAAGALYTCTATGTAVAAGAYVNTALVSGADALNPSRVLTASNPANYFAPAPGIDIKKYVNGHDTDVAPGIVVNVGSTVTWTYVVTNTGNVALTNFTLTDDKIGLIAATNCSPLPIPSFAPGAVTTCTMTGVAIAGNYGNTGVVSGTWITPDPGVPDLPGFPYAPSQPVVLTDNDPAHYTGVSTSLGDYVWLDVDHDGVQDPGEPPISGVPVRLVTPTGSITVTTSITGYYRFDNLTPGVPYSVVFGTPPGYQPTISNGSVNTPDNSDADPNTGTTQPIVLTPGEHNPNIDAGFWTRPNVSLTKSTLSPGVTRPGAQLRYQMVVRNSGPTLSRNVVLTDPIPAQTTYVTGSAVPDATLINDRLEWRLGDLQPGTAVTVTFAVVVDRNVRGTSINNTAILSTSDLLAEVQSNLVQNPTAPTAVMLDRFDATLTCTPAAGCAVNVGWATVLELNTLGFELMRSDTANRADAVRVNPTLIAAKGASGGSYVYVDPAGSAQSHYWLIESDLNGTKTEYGPVLVGTPGTARAPERVSLAPLTPLVQTADAVETINGVGIPASDRAQQAVIVGQQIIIAPAASTTAAAKTEVAGEQAAAQIAAPAPTQAPQVVAPPPQARTVVEQPERQLVAPTAAIAAAQAPTVVTKPAQPAAAPAAAARQTTAPKPTNPMLVVTLAALGTMSMTLFGVAVLMTGIVVVRRRRRN